MPKPGDSLVISYPRHTILGVLVALGLLRKQKFELAGEEGFEPSLTDPESAVLPLDDSPVRVRLYPK